MNCVYISEDGQLVAFNPSDYCWIPRTEDVEAGIYEPQFETEVNTDGNLELTITQTMMPLVRLR